jgi:3-hydroxybutyrate dehydrogenase
MKLKHKSAIVTDSTSGISLGIARALAQQGADIVLNGFGDAGEIEFTRAELERKYGVRVRYSGADISRPDQVRAMAGLATSEFSKVDIVVNNAGIQHVATIEDFDDTR